ncbi:hypothetical protein [Sporosarcina highlanderae]|uniref:Uncharacterized protein n=1 Tax=Sporosarcina highlanderae TaxID=3035916 RepID=A0ABT8JY43_9BACL|nr:hypothetical protein [Sporosarcina highlanderae]MDN4609059.1 hypothetical protein [Sporosarcina highlanderae]
MLEVRIYDTLAEAVVFIVNMNDANFWIYRGVIGKSLNGGDVIDNDK